MKKEMLISLPLFFLGACLGGVAAIATAIISVALVGVEVYKDAKGWV